MYYAVTGAVIVMVSALFGVLMVKRYAAQQPTEVKAVLFGLYFWGLAFLQLLICALAYFLSGKYGG